MPGSSPLLQQRGRRRRGAPALRLLALALLTAAGHTFRPLHDDALATARCDASCTTTVQPQQKNACVKKCLSSNVDKPGSCPQGSIISPFASVCLDACETDAECPDVTKCCRHQCGITCQIPQDLDRIPGLPDVPREITVRGKRKRSLSIRWQTGEQTDADAVVYVIEERHHAGKYFAEGRMGAWSPCYYRSARAGVAVLKHMVKPGRWYQFRIAAVNANGTRGFSEHVGFLAQQGPRPPKAPQNVTTGPLYYTNGSLYTELRWSRPQSDLPVQKYKVFWSRRLHGATALDSVLVLQQTISKDNSHFTIRELEPDSMYFLQVQAISQFGRDVFRGEKSGLVLNTTNFINETASNNEKLTAPSRVEDLQLQKLFWSRGDLKARIVWKPKNPQQKHTISWWSGPCKHDKSSTHTKLAATTKASHFDIYELRFECRYRVSVRAAGAEGGGPRAVYDTSVTFTTPACKDLQGRNRRVKCNRRHSFVEP